MTAKKSCLSVILFNNLLIMQKQHETVTHTELRTEILDNLIPVSLCKFVFDFLLLVDNSLYYIQPISLVNIFVLNILEIE